MTLTDYPEVDTENVINSIIMKLLKVSKDEASLNRYIQQLLILSRLRKLDEEIVNKLVPCPSHMIEQDYLYNKAKEETIAEMLKDPSLTLEKIASFTKTSVAYVKQVRDEYTKK